MRILSLKLLIWTAIISLVIIACNSKVNVKQKLQLGTFGAFYTRIESGEDFEKYSRTGDYADIVVDLGTGNSKFVFWRGSSYLPYFETPTGKWYVEEVLPRKGDGEGIRPDNINAYSHANLIKDGPDTVVVHWRYLPQFSGPNPRNGADRTRFVDEYFTITHDGKVIRTIRQGTQKVDKWTDPENRILQTFDLTSSGIANLKTSRPVERVVEKTVEGSEVIENDVGKPVACWKFDEARGDRATESVSGQESEIFGSKSLWKKGVSGTALEFDGYNTLITLPVDSSPKLSDGLTLDGWIAIGAYPWNWAPIVQQGDDEGFFLGLDGHGHPGLKIKIGDVWEELVSDEFLERSTWYYLTGTYDKGTGKMKIYVDGEPAGEKTVRKENVVQSNSEIKIGKGMNRRPVDPVREITFIDSYGFDGLIDEVRIYNTSLSAQQIQQSYSLYNLSQTRKKKPDMDSRNLPVFHSSGKFGACYTKLKFHETWDNLFRFGDHPDVVVEFDQLPTQFVFWRGTGYVPMMVNEKGQWYSNEFNETWGTSGGQGCQEPMSDKESFTNFARIIENTEARVVVQWRYPLQDVLHVFANVDEETGWGDWSDWYFYIYPDGVAVKKMHLWTHGARNHEWQESMGIFGANQHPEDIIETTVALTMMNLEGEEVQYSWIGGPPPNVNEPEEKVIQVINYKADFDPVTIGKFINSDVYGGELTPYSVFPSWNHWPVAQMPSDGRYASFPDRAAHSSLTHVRLPDFAEDFGERPYQEKLLMEGMLDWQPEELIALASSWMDPPCITSLRGCKGKGYDRSQRAFVLTALEKEFSFKVIVADERYLLNPCFVIRNWTKNSKAIVTVDGMTISHGPDFRQGIIRDLDGSWTLVVWIRMQTGKSTEFNFSQN
jgi:hypothetical protein